MAEEMNIVPLDDTVENEEKVEEKPGTEKKGRRSAQKRSAITATLQEGNAMLKEEGEMEGRRRTRSSTRGVRRGRPKKEIEKEEDDEEVEPTANEEVNNEPKKEENDNSEAPTTNATDGEVLKEQQSKDNGETEASGNNGTEETDVKEKEDAVEAIVLAADEPEIPESNVDATPPAEPAQPVECTPDLATPAANATTTEDQETEEKQAE
ncbi:hypothetical protein B566_EDAN003811 [Ephemera danica]|nr:hypothetical protein B566_EDAN003811 [Ephemera danica]